MAKKLQEMTNAELLNQYNYQLLYDDATNAEIVKRVGMTDEYAAEKEKPNGRWEQILHEAVEKLDHMVSTEWRQTRMMKKSTRKTENLFTEWLIGEVEDTIYDVEDVTGYEISYHVKSYIGSIKTDLKSALTLDEEETKNIVIAVLFEDGGSAVISNMTNFRKYALKNGLTEEDLFYCL